MIYSSFKKNIEFDEERHEIRSPSYSLKLQNPSEKLLDSLRSMQDKGASLDSYEGEDMALFYYMIEKMKQRSMLQHTIMHEKKPFARIIPMRGGIDFEQPVTGKISLSRFAYTHIEDGKYFLKTPLSSIKIELLAPEASLIIHSLTTPTPSSSIMPKSFLQALQAGNFLSQDDAYIALKQWEFHDLLFHARSRKGRHDYPIGGTFRFKDEIEHLTAIEEKKGLKTIPLHKPDLNECAKNDPSFTEVLENRKSIRTYSENLLTLNQLGEFLYRIARVKEKGRNPQYEYTKRVYPSGGAIYEQEIYLTIDRCEGLLPGLYHYHPEKHCLIKISKASTETKELLIGAKHSTGMEELPPILITITCRFQRFSWKYQSLAYATMLKNSGVLIQTMYLVATAMNLPPCAVGCGDSDLFAKAAKLNYLEETSMAEFILGPSPLID